MILKEEMNKYLHFCEFQKELDSKTIKAYRTDLEQFFSFMEKYDTVPGKEETVLPKIVPKNTIEQLLNYLYRGQDSEEYTKWQKKLLLRDTAVIEMLFATGLRISELCHLQNRYFDSRTGLLCIQGKGSKERYLQIGSSDVLATLNAYKNEFKEEIKQHDISLSIGTGSRFQSNQPGV